MPVVTEIQRQKRKDARYNVYIDGEYAFALSDLELSTSGIRVGQTLEPQEVEQFQDEAKQAKVNALAVRFIGVRSRSKREMSHYLKRKDIEASEIERVIDRLETNGLLDDKQFAINWIAGRNAARPRSRMVLRQELLAKGVERGVIEEALSEMADDENEVRLAADVARKKRRLSGYQDRRKLEGYLGRQGYSFETIKKALALLDDEVAGLG